MAKKNQQPKEQPKEAKKKSIVVILFNKYLKSLSTSELAAIEERGEVIAIPGFKKFLDKLSQAEVLALL